MSQLFTWGGQSIGASASVISPSNEYSGLIFFRMDWLDFLAFQRTLKNLLPHHSSKASILWCSAFFRSYFHTHVEKAMAPHSSTLAWKIPWMEEPGRLQSMGSWRVGHHWATSLSLFTFLHWRRKWQPTSVFLPGESQGLEPGGLLSVGLHRVGHYWSDLAAAAAAAAHNQ